MQPNYQNISLPFCGQPDEPPAPAGPPFRPSNQECDNIMCDIAFKRPRLIDPPVNSDDDTLTADCENTKNQKSATCTQNTKENDPRLYINEFASCRTDVENRAEFVELRLFPQRQGQQPRENHYKIVAFTAISKQLQLVINLHRNSANLDGLLLLNNPNENFVQLPSKRNFNLLPCSDKEPVVLLLLQEHNVPKDSWQQISLGRRNRGFPPRNLNNPVGRDKNIFLLDVFKQTVIDGYIYGITPNTPIGNNIKEILEVRNTDCNFILPIGNPNDQHEKEASLNACPSFNPIPFDRAHFKLGVPTPGRHNDCTSQRQNQLNKINQPRNSKNVVGVTKESKDDLDCVCPADKAKLQIDEIDALINYEIRYIQQKYDKNYNSKFYPVSNFKYNVWPKLRRRGFDSRNPFFPDVTPFKVYSKGIPFLQDRWRCEVCHQRFKTCPHSLHPKTQKDKFTQPDGRPLTTQTDANQRYLVDHTNRKSHYTSVLHSVRQDRRKYDADARVRYRQPEQKDLRELANIFLTSFTIVKTNTALRGTETWYKTLTKIGANVGVGPVMHGRGAVVNMIKFMSDEGFSRIKNYLVDTQAPFTFILDGASDKTHNHYMSLFIQSIEGGHTIPYFFGLIHGDKSSTAENQLRLIKEWLSQQGPNFEEYFKRQIIGVSSDSAPVMKKLHRLIQAWYFEENPDSNRTLVQTYCLAHKLNLASRSALIPIKSDDDYGQNGSLKYFQTIEKFMQTTYTWISLAQRRIGDYREIMIASKQPRIELQELHVERWISSEHKTIKYFLGAWITVMGTMEAISDDTTNYKANVRGDAETFYNKMQDKQRLLTIVFLQDFTAAFKKWSEILQYFVGLMSDQLQHYNNLIQDLEEIAILNGPVLTSFLKSCKCPASSQEFGCSGVEEYENSETVMWRGVTFYHKDDEAPSLTILGPDLIRKSIERLDFYISKDMMVNLNVLCPERFPAGENVLRQNYPSFSTENTLPVYAREEIEYLGRIFGMRTDDLILEWAELFLSILTSPSWDILRTHRSSDAFWSRALRDDTLAWTDTTRLFIHTMKTVSVGSSMVEGSFSMFNSVKNQRRSQIGDALLTSLLNLSINGPADVDFFDEFAYAEAWKRAGRRLPGQEDCRDKADDERAIEDMLGLNEIEDDLINDGEDLPEIDPALVKEPYTDVYDSMQTFQHRYYKIERIRTVLM